VPAVLPVLPDACLRRFLELPHAMAISPVIDNRRHAVDAIRWRGLRFPNAQIVRLLVEVSL
jgi:hypothetical protein